MLTSDVFLPLTAALFGGPAAIIPLLASILFGIAVMLLLTALAGNMPVTASAGATATSVRAARPRREPIQRDGLLGLAFAFMPFFRPIAEHLPLDSLKDTLKERYAAAGWPGAMDDDEVFALSLMGGVLASLPLLLILLVLKPLLAPLAIAGIIIGPGIGSMMLNGKAEDRHLAIARTMPFVLDLLVLTMRAGASFTMAIERVTIDYQDHPIGREFRGILTDIDLGSTMREALENLAARVPVQTVQSFVDDVIQSEELGRPVADTLEHMTDRVRANRVQDAMETAGAAKVLVLAPGILVLFASLIILFAPFIARYASGGYR